MVLASSPPESSHIDNFHQKSVGLIFLWHKECPGTEPNHTLLAPWPERKSPFLEMILIGPIWLTSLSLVHSRWPGGSGVLCWPGVVINLLLWPSQKSHDPSRLGRVPQWKCGFWAENSSKRPLREVLALCPGTRAPQRRVDDQLKRISGLCNQQNAIPPKWNYPIVDPGWK